MDDNRRNLDELPISSGDSLWALNFIDARFEPRDPVFDTVDEDGVFLRKARRRRKAVRTAATGLALCLLSSLAACGTEDQGGLRAQDAILVQLEPQAFAPPLPNPDASGPPIVALTALGPDDAPPLLRYPVPAGVDPTELARALDRSTGVAYAEPIFLYQPERVPNDPRLKDLWGLSRIGAGAAWSRSTGDRRVTVAVIDDGVALSHPDLAANRWSNPLEIADNGSDDDGDGYRDDVSGWNFVDGNNDAAPVLPERWHGTHVAGIIGAVGDNSVGVTGVSWQVSLMALRALGPNGGRSDALARAIDYATDHGARVVNASWSGPRSQAIERAIARAAARGVLVVAAAGNSSADSPAFPASAAGVVSVSASGPDDLLASFSNRGALLAAPGVGILSTTAPGQYERYDGTSMAAAHVSGLAALLWSSQPGASLEQVRAAIARGAVPVEGVQVGRIDASAALAALGPGAGPGPLRVSQSALAFSTWPGHVPKAQSFSVRADGGGNRHFFAHADAPWVRLSLAEGETPARVNVHLDSTGLSLGDHLALVTFDGGLPVALTLHVGNGATLTARGPGCALTGGQLRVTAKSVCTLSAPGANLGVSSAGVQWQLPGGALSTGATLTAQFNRPGSYRLLYSTEEGVASQLPVLVE